MAVGIFGAVGHGFILPSFSFIFGEIIDAFNATTPGEVYDSMLRISIYFIYIGIGAIVVTYCKKIFSTKLNF
jgi:phosphate starvation-inducible membrane PsiE